MDFMIHKSGIHVFYQEDIKNMVLMKTVEYNMRTFTKRDIEGANSAMKLYAKLLYLLSAYSKWLIKKQPNKKTAKFWFGILILLKRYGKTIFTLKGNTVRGNPTVGALYSIKIPKEITNLRKTVFLTADVLFFNWIPLFISLSR